MAQPVAMHFAAGLALEFALEVVLGHPLGFVLGLAPEELVVWPEGLAEPEEHSLSSEELQVQVPASPALLLQQDEFQTLEDTWLARARPLQLRVLWRFGFGLGFEVADFGLPS